MHCSEVAPAAVLFFVLFGGACQGAELSTGRDGTAGPSAAGTSSGAGGTSSVGGAGGISYAGGAGVSSAGDAGRSGSAGWGSGGGTGSAGSSGAVGGANNTGGSGDSGAPAAVGGSGNAGAGGSMGGQAGTPSQPDVLPDGKAEPDHPHLQYFGRWDFQDPKRPTGSWGPIGFKLRFQGTSLVLILADEQLNLAEEGTGNFYQYSIDGGPFQILRSTSEQRYPLATALPDGDHDVMFVRRTESKFGQTTLLGVHIDAGKALLPPPLRPTRKLEVFGDSISAGLANENTGWYTNATENGYMAFGPQLARLLGAEWHVEARGGGSFFNDFWLPMVPWFDKTLGPDKLEHRPSADALVWNFAAFQPDVFVLALGTNDFSDQYPHIDESSYVQKYKAFLTQLRGYYANVEIFCLAPFKEGAPWDEARRYIPLAVHALSDPHVHAVNPVGNGTTDRWLSYPTDYVAGDQYHPNLIGHEKIAHELADIIRPIMGW